MKNKDFRISRNHVASRVAHGPGSMFGEAEAHALARAGRYKQAVRHAEAHNNAIGGGRGVASTVIKAWYDYGIEGRGKR